MREAVEAAGSGRVVEAPGAGARGGQGDGARGRPEQWRGARWAGQWRARADGAMTGRAVEAAEAVARDGGGLSRGARWRAAGAGLAGGGEALAERNTCGDLTNFGGDPLFKPLKSTFSTGW